jgi:hypothetical protein
MTLVFKHLTLGLKYDTSCVYCQETEESNPRCLHLARSPPPYHQYEKGESR